MSVITLLLKRRGFRVVPAYTIEAARASAARLEFDILISDIGLPDGTGRELFRELAARRPLIGIAISGFGTAQDVERSLAAGFLVHLAKPVTIAALETAIAAAIARLARNRATQSEPGVSEPV